MGKENTDFCSLYFIIDVVLVFSLLAVAIQLLFCRAVISSCLLQYDIYIDEDVRRNMFFIHNVC